MTDTDARLRERLRWAIHGLLLVGLALVLLLVTLVIVASWTRNDPKEAGYALAGTWGFFVVYAAGTTSIVAWKAANWLHALLVHVAALGAILLGAGVIVGSLFVGVRWH